MMDNDCMDKLDIAFPTCKDDNNMRQLGMLLMILDMHQQCKNFFLYIHQNIYISRYISESDITKVTSM